MSTLATWARFPEDEMTFVPAQRARTVFGREPLLGALVAGMVYALVGALVIPRYGVMTDALARVANTYYVLFSRDPHIESIGFVWNPLPSLLALPLLLLKDVWPSLVRQAVAANLITAIFGGIAVFYLLRILRRLELPTSLRWAIAVLFAFNPAIVFYASNGMSDLMLDATMIAAVDGLWAFLEEESFSSLFASGMWVALGFLIRYEIIMWAVVVAAALAYGLARFPLPNVSVERRGDWIKGLLLFWMGPLVVVVTTWIFLNWAIMGDPLYFLHSAYGETAGIATGAYSYEPTNAAHLSVLGTLGYMLRQTLLFPPVLVGLLGFLIFGLLGHTERHVRALILVAATVGAPLLQVALLYRGNSAGWLRFFLPFIPFGFILIAYGAFLVARRGGRRWLVWPVALLILLTGNGATSYALTAVSQPLRYERPQTFQDADAVIKYLDSYPTLTVLVDSYLSFPILVRVQRVYPRHFFITSDRDFRQLLAHPLGRMATILVPEPKGVGTLDALNRRYPGLWAHGAPWAHLIGDFPQGFHWRLYAINPLIDDYRTALSYLDSHARPGDAVVVDTLFKPDAYLRYAHTNLPAYNFLPSPAGSQASGPSLMSATDMHQRIKNITAGYQRLWVITSPTVNHDPFKLLSHDLALSARRINLRGHTSIQLGVYQLGAHPAASAQSHPATLQQLNLLASEAPGSERLFSVSVGTPGASGLLVGSVKELPRAAQSWHFGPLPATGKPVSLTLFNPSNVAGDVVVSLYGRRSIRRKQLHVAANANVEVQLSSWDAALSHERIGIQADVPVVPMRSQRDRATIEFSYGLLSPGPRPTGSTSCMAAPTNVACVGAGAAPFKAPALHVTVSPMPVRLHGIAHLTIVSAPFALVHVTVAFAGRPAVTLFDVTDNTGHLSLALRVPGQTTPTHGHAAAQVTVQATTAAGQTQTSTVLALGGS